MLWSLCIIYILFAGKFKAKIDIYIYRFETFVSFIVNFRKNCSYI